MRNKSRYRTIAVNVLISLVISLMVNFSYFVFMALAPSVEQSAPEPQLPRTTIERNLAADTVAANPTEKVSRLRIAVDSLQNDIVIREENFGRLAERGRRTNPIMSGRGRWFIAVDIVYFFIVSMFFLSIMTFGTERKKSRYVYRFALCFALFVLFYFIAPQITWSGEVVIAAQKRMLNPMLLLKLSISFAVAALYGKIYELLYRNQSMEVENEQLKNENLTSQYNMLVGQVNPHFLFNSLNSLSMLVREQKNDDALTYIDRMADTYRYIIQEGDNDLTTLEEELNFLESYKFLLEVRYDGKLFFEIDIPAACRERPLPPLSIQPLVENAVKHNTITSSKPMTIRIAVEGDYLTISNTIVEKIESETVGTGIGLKNLARRYRLMTGKEISVENNGTVFTVKLPLGKTK